MSAEIESKMPEGSRTSVAAAAAAGDSVDSGTKRPASSDASLEGKKKRRSVDDDPWLTEDSFEIEGAFSKLKSLDFFTRLLRGRVRLTALLSKRAELELGDHIIIQLEKLVASFADLLPSVNKAARIYDLGHDDIPELLRLVHLAKQILLEWEALENSFSQPHQCSVSRICTVPGIYPDVVPSAWIFEYKWLDEAYEELLSLRRKYSCLLDQVYLDSYTSYSKKNGVSGSTAFSQRKLLKFVASSREEMNIMDVEKCYKRVMGIKELCTRMDQASGLASQCALGNLADQTQLRNWRDEIYDQIAASRKLYSLKLDKLLWDGVFEMKSARAGEVDDKARRSFKERRKLIEDALQFLANFRDGIAFLSEESCLRQLADIKQFMENVEDSLPEMQSTPHSPGQTQCAKGFLTNWRCLEYDQLQNKKHRFIFQLYDVYLEHKETWSKMPACSGGLSKLEYHLGRASDLYKMRRGEMSLFETRNDYFGTVSCVTMDVVESIHLIRVLLCCLEEGTRPKSWHCDDEILIPKELKLASASDLNDDEDDWHPSRLVI